MSLVNINDSTAVQIDQAAILKALKLNPADPRTQALLLTCQRYGLDPILRHMLLIEGNPYVTRDGYLHVAHASGQFDGMEVLDSGKDETHWWAKVAVYRKDMSRPFTYVGRYPFNGSNKNYGPEMAIKTAEVMALRRAFDVTGIGAADEQQWDAVDVQEATIPDPAAEAAREALKARIGTLSDGARAVLKSWWHDEMLPSLPHLSTIECKLVDDQVTELIQDEPAPPVKDSGPDDPGITADGLERRPEHTPATRGAADSPAAPLDADDVAELFEAEPVDVTEITPPEPKPKPVEKPDRATPAQRSKLFALIPKAYPPISHETAQERDERRKQALIGLCAEFGQTVESRAEITKKTAAKVIDHLESLTSDARF